MTESIPLAGIGSDMETVQEEFLRSPATPPWETSKPVTYTATARQALHFVSETLWAAGHRRLLFPEFYCESMLAPFLSRDWKLAPLRVDGSLTIESDHLVEATSEPGDRPVALLALYFGRKHDAKTRAAIVEIQAAGGVVIDDETHRVLDPGPTDAAIRVASLRKLLPVADGAYLIGDVATGLTPTAPDASAEARWAAMDAKRAAIEESAELKQTRRQFETSNEDLEASLSASTMSPRSLDLVRRFDYRALAERRKANALALEGELADESLVEIVNPSSVTPIASHLVVRVPDVDRVRAALAARRIYCPIHWVRHSSPVAKADWPADLLSIPLDHRYTAEQMRAVARHLKDVVRS